MIKYSIKNYWKFIIIIIILTIFQVLANLELPSYMADIVANGIAKLNQSYIYRIGIKMLAVSLLGTLFGILCNFVTSIYAAKFSKDLRNITFKKVIEMDQENINKFDTSSLITRCTNDINQVQMFSTMFFKMIFFTFFMGTGGILKAVEKSSGMSSLAIAILIAVSFVGLILYIVYKTIIPKFEIIQKLIDKINNKFRENLNGILVIRSLNKQKYEEKSFNNINSNFSNTNYFISKVMSATDPLLLFIINTVSIAIICIVSVEASSIIEISNMIAFLQYATDILMSFFLLTLIFFILPRAVISFKRIKEVLDEENNIVNGKLKPKKLKGKIEFKDLCFKYPKSESYILKNINLIINPGETIAFVGSTGSGKSTLVNMIPRLYDATEGELLIDNKSIKKYDIYSLRKNISFVTQKAILFSGTIKSNILNGNEKATDKEIILSTKNSESYSFINKKEDKFNSKISQSGTNISGGQKQRLAISRALVKKSNIIIFDDSFSALDFKTDYKIRKNLFKFYSNKTILIVAQRIGTIINADKIIVLDNGNIVGIGTHSDLLENCQIYKEIALSQLNKEELYE